MGGVSWRTYLDVAERIGANRDASGRIGMMTGDYDGSGNA
jgi:hypothetical protein